VGEKKGDLRVFVLEPQAQGCNYSGGFYDSGSGAESAGGIVTCNAEYFD